MVFLFKHLVQVDAVVGLCHFDETFLLGDGRCIFKGDPVHVARIYPQDFIQEMSAVFAESDQVVPVCRHPLFVVVRDQDAAVGIPQFGSDDAQRLDNVRFQVFDKEDAPPVEQRRVEPQAVVRMPFPR